MKFRISGTLEADSWQDAHARLGEVSSLAVYAVGESCLSSARVYDLLKSLRKQKQEHFVAIALNIRGEIIKRKTVSVGTLNALYIRVNFSGLRFRLMRQALSSPTIIRQVILSRLMMTFV